MSIKGYRSGCLLLVCLILTGCYPQRAPLQQQWQASVSAKAKVIAHCNEAQVLVTDLNKLANQRIYQTIDGQYCPVWWGQRNA